MERQDRLYAIPNKILGKCVCPELVGRFSILEASERLNELISDTHELANIKAVFSQFRSSETVPEQFLTWIQHN